MASKPTTTQQEAIVTRSPATSGSCNIGGCHVPSWWTLRLGTLEVRVCMTHGLQLRRELR